MGLIASILGLSIAFIMLLLVLAVALFAFWLWMLIDSANRKEWGWFAGLLVTWVMGFGQFILAVIYYFAVYKHKKRKR